MIKRLFDRYYLVLLRWCDSVYGRGRFLTIHIACTMSITIMLNVISVFMLFSSEYMLLILIIVGIIGIICMYIIEAIYNKKRREELREKYKRESLDSRHRGLMWVLAYEVFSLVFFILSAVIFAKSVGN